MTKLAKKSSRNGGFSLIEVMVTIGIMAITMYAMSTWLINLFSEQTALQQKMSALDLQATLTRLMADTTQCTDNLLTVSWPAGPPPASVNIGSPAVPNSGLHYFNPLTGTPSTLAIGYGPVTNGSGLTVSSIQLQNITPSGANQYNVDVVVSFSGTQIPLKPIAARKVPVSTITGGSVTPQSCASSMITGVTAPYNAGDFCQNPAGAATDPAWHQSVHLGASRNCVAYLASSKAGNTFVNFGCYYDPVTGWVYVCAKNTEMTCAWNCFN